MEFSTRIFFNADALKIKISYRYKENKNTKDIALHENEYILRYIEGKHILKVHVKNVEFFFKEFSKMEMLHLLTYFTIHRITERFRLEETLKST